MLKQYDHKETEKQVQALWEAEKVYAFDEKSDKGVFSIDTPPPTVSGSLHIGHLFSYTQTDLMARYKRMQGYNVFYPMGFDDNGLATERFVEKKHKIRGHTLKRSEFIELCLTESKEMGQVFAQIWKTMGLSVDWTKLYSTISDEARKVSQYSFLELYKKGLVYKKEEPALYCTSCRTTVAQAELDDAEVSSCFNDIVFKVGGNDLVVSTTRPELLPACVALFYHPEDDRYKGLADKTALVPVFEREVPILPDDGVSMEKGTGLVMCCTFGDQADVAWYKKHGLPFIQVIGQDGTWQNAGPLDGLKVHQARKKIIEILREKGLLKDQCKVKHNVNVHERCKQEIEYLVLHQWFVKVLDHKEKFLEQGEQITWHPSFMKARYKDWVQHLGWDWCISRQRFYGIPFPVWYCKDCGQTLVADEKSLPVDPQEQSYPAKVCDNCAGSNIVPETDVMDTWNTSSLTPQINIGWPQAQELTLPMSLRPQAHDIIRTWTFYTIVKAYYHSGVIPWKDIAVSGFVVAKGREKISKSKGNTPTDPEQLLRTYPADVLRYWAANGRLGVDTLFSENQFRIGQRLLTKLWNAFRFCKDHIEAHDPSKEMPKLDDLNQWLLHNVSDTVQAFCDNFEAYEHAAALEKAERFFWHTFCDNYLELIKDRIFNPDAYDADTIDATRYVLYESCFAILKLFAPFVPHITEKLYQLFFKEKEGVTSLHNTLMSQERYEYAFAHSALTIERVIKIVDVIRKGKSEHSLSLKTEIAELHICSTDQNILKHMQLQEHVLMGITKAKQIVYRDEKIEQGRFEQKDGAWYATVVI